MKKIFIILSRDPRSAQIMMFFIKALLNKNYHIHLFYHETKLYLNAYGKLKINNKNIKIHPFKILKQNKLNFFKKTIKIIKEFKKVKPSHVIAVDKKSLLISLILSFFDSSFKKIHMVLDFDDPKSETIKEGIITKIQFFFSKKVDFFLFPSLQRARKFFRLSQLNNKSFTVLSNHFPLNFKPNIGNKLDGILKKKKINYTKIVCSLGTIGDNHYFEELVESVVSWDDGNILIIGGWPNKNMKNILNEIIIKNNLQKKVLILANITEKLWLEILFKSHLGVCFYKQDSISHRYMAGPSTKLSNYLLANIPFIACDNHDFKIFKSKFNICDLVDPSNPENIAKKINKLLIDKKKYNLLRKNSKIAYLKNLNFDVQFDNFYKKLISLEKSYFS